MHPALIRQSCLKVAVRGCFQLVTHPTPLSKTPSGVVVKCKPRLLHTPHPLGKLCCRVPSAACFQLVAHPTPPSKHSSRSCCQARTSTAKHLPRTFAHRSSCAHAPHKSALSRLSYSPRAHTEFIVTAPSVIRPASRTRFSPRLPQPIPYLFFFSPAPCHSDKRTAT